MPNPTRVAYNEDLGKFLGVNDDGNAEAYDPEDVPQAVKSGRVVVHLGKPEVIASGFAEPGDDDAPPPGRYEGPHVQEDLDNPGRDTVRVEPYETRTRPATPEELDATSMRTDIPGARANPEPERMAGDTWGGGGGLPGAMMAAAGAIGRTAMGASPGIPGVRPNQGAKTAPGSSDLASTMAALRGYQPMEGYDQWSDQAALMKGQKEAAQNRLAAGLSRAGTTINAALTNRQPDYSSSNDLERMSGAPVQDVQQRRAAQDEALKRQQALQGMQGAQYQRQMQLEMMDPGSERSARARAVLQQANPTFAKQFSPEEFEKLSANDIGGLGELGKTVLTHTMEREKADREKDTQVAAAKAAEDARIAAENKRHDDSEAGEDRRTKWRISAENQRERDRLAAAERGSKTQRLEDQEAKAMQDDLDPNKGRGSNLALNQRRLDQADRLKALVTEGNGDVRNLDRRQMEELAIGLDSMLSGGGHGAESQVKALVPSTAWGDGAKLKEWLSNDPQGTNQVAFVRRMLETVDRERSVAAYQIKSAQIKRLGAHSGLKERNPERYYAILNNYGISPDEEASGKPAPTVVKEVKGASGRTLQKMSDGTVRVKPDV